MFVIRFIVFNHYIYVLNFCILQKPENGFGEAETSFLEMCFFSQNSHSLVLYLNRFSLGDYPNYRNYDLSGPVRASAEKKKDVCTREVRSGANRSVTSTIYLSYILLLQPIALAKG